jgi:hypothetical protein
MAVFTHKSGPLGKIVRPSAVGDDEVGFPLHRALIDP